MKTTECTTKGSTCSKPRGRLALSRISVNVIRSGSLALDNALGVGGYPRGRIVEVYGPESSGKTT